jgi:ParB/RepB/Spo0J family partition protein
MSERDYTFAVLPLGDIDPPQLAMRDAMDDHKLVELSRDIQRNGVLQPLGVFLVDNRYRIIYGHRRFLAAELANEARVPCRIHPDGDAHEEDFKLSENRYREDVNPAAEATWFADLLERKCGDDIAKLCALVNATESYVNGRLDLLRGDAMVLEALRVGKITLSVARELNKFKAEDWRRFYLGDAIEQGATSAMVNRWRMERDRSDQIAAAAARGETAAAVTPDAAPLASVDRCFICELDDDPLQMEFVRVHVDCHNQHRRMRRAQLRGDGVPA